VVAPRERWEAIEELCAAASSWEVRVIEGGEHRQDSVRCGLEASPEAAIVCVHDAARPLCPPQLVRDVVAAAVTHGAATAALRISDTVKRVDPSGRIVTTLDRTELVTVQTPQAFSMALLREAHERALADHFIADDDCALVEHIGRPVVTVAGDPRNLKVTGAADLGLVESLLAES
jgi:2-C-methyl-D-erythritol 4-phosphate cytidylyltransferase